MLQILNLICLLGNEDDSLAHLATRICSQCKYGKREF